MSSIGCSISNAVGGMINRSKTRSLMRVQLHPAIMNAVLRRSRSSSICSTKTVSQRMRIWLPKPLKSMYDFKYMNILGAFTSVVVR